MTQSTRDITIGAVTVAVFFAVIYWLSAPGADDLAANDGFYRLTAAFNRVDGLLPGDDVRLSGVKIGAVEAQELDERYNAILTLAISSDVALPDDTSAAIHTNGLFGSKFVVLEPGGGFDNLADGDEILFTQDSLVVEDLLELIINEGKAKQAAAQRKSGG